jgi:uncharacterized membrane protein
MKWRMAISVTALAGLFVSLYLLFYSLGFYGALMCGTGGCETVQTSSYARFMGMPVAGWGAAWYGLVVLVAFVGVQDRFADEKWPDRWLLVLATLGLAFSVYLTGLELFVLHAICQWCVVSAVLTVAIFGLALLAARSGGRAPESL